MQYFISIIHNFQDQSIILDFENMNENFDYLLIFSVLYIKDVVTILLSNLQFNKIKSKKQIKTSLKKSFLEKHKCKSVDLNKK